MIPRNRIRLSRLLRAQTTPYPDAHKWLERGSLFLVLILLIGSIYFLAKPKQKSSIIPESKQILGQQEEVKPAEYEIYIVKKGDTLFNLSQKYEVSWQTLAKLNNLEEPYILKIGQELKIPKK